MRKLLLATRSRVDCTRLWKGRKWTVWHILAAVITVIVVFNEYLSYSLQTWTWSNLSLESSQDNDAVRIMFVADPQLQGNQGEPALFGFITRWDSDTFLSRTFQRAYHRIKPDVIIFMGDLLDEGSIATDSAYGCYYKRFQDIFSTPSHVKHIYLAGDNDVGGEGFDRREEWKIKRFQHFFLQAKDLPPVINYKYLDFFILNLSPYEPLSPQLIKRLQRMAANSTAPYRFLLDHVNLIGRPRSVLVPILQQIKPNIAFTAHTHDARILTCMDCREEAVTMPPRANFWRGSTEITRDNTVHSLNLRNTAAIDEVVVPTASYRMGVSQMGYGAAIVDSFGHMKYTILWSPSRYNQLFLYLFLVMVVFGAFLALCMRQCCIRLSRQMRPG